MKKEIIYGKECFKCSSMETKCCPHYSKAFSKTIPIKIYVCKKCCEECWKNKELEKFIGTSCPSKIW